MASPTLLPAPSRSVFLLRAALIILAGWFVYQPAIHGNWLWDDAREITDNAVLRDPQGLWKIWSAPAGLDYFPLKTTVQWFEWHLWGDSVAGYHLASLALHLASAFLIWRLLRKLGVRLAWLGGLLFAVHPLAVESVAWISELKNTLSLPLLMLSMCAYVDFSVAERASVSRHPRRTDETLARSATGPGAGPYIRSLLYFLAAMLSKSTVAMFPVVLLLYAWWRGGRITWRDLKATLPFFAISIGLGLVTVWFQHHRAIGELSMPSYSLPSRLAVAGQAVIFYVSKSILPLGLSPLYPRWASAPWVPLLSWFLILAASACLWAKRASWGRPVLFGFGCLLVNLLPVLGIVPMAYQRIGWVADHFAYLPLVGVVALAAGAWGVLDSVGRRSRAREILLGCVAAAVVVALAFESRGYAAVFRSEESLWTRVLERHPGSWIAQNNLGNVLIRSGRTEEAVRHFKESLRLKPDYAAPHQGLGDALINENRAPEAIAEYETLLRLEPASPSTHNNLGSLYAGQGRMADAADQFRQALKFQSDYPEAENNLGVILLRTGQPKEAREHFAAAIRLKPDYAAAHAGLGKTLAVLGQRAEAVAELREALRLAPGLNDVRGNLKVLGYP